MSITALAFDQMASDATPIDDTNVDLSVKRTRRGEKFTPANEVNLHGNDFEWVDLLKELPSEDSGLYYHFRSKCSERLQSIEREIMIGCGGKKCSECFYPLGHGSRVEISMEALQPKTTEPEKLMTCFASPGTNTDHKHDPQSWERHYMTNKQHFPVKNYIVHAFPSLVPRAYPSQPHKEALDTLCRGSTPIEASPHIEGAQHEPPSPRPAEATASNRSVRRVIMEAGCGTGSVTHPLMKLFPLDTFICHDISGTAVETLRSHEVSQQHIASGGALATFVLDLSLGGHALTTATEENCSSFADSTKKGNFDFILLVFVLSAMPSLRHMVHVLRQLRSYLKPGSGRLLFRDYGALDHNFFRFHRQENMFLESSLNFLKGDGTEQFFFDIETVHELFALAGLAPASETVYHCNRIVNRKNGKRMDKVFVNGEFCVAPLPEDVE
jgi:methyltransferase-like protein 6